MAIANMGEFSSMAGLPVLSDCLVYACVFCARAPKWLLVRLREQLGARVLLRLDRVERFERLTRLRAEVSLNRDPHNGEQIARALSTDVNLVALKIDALREAGHPLHPLDHNTSFLK
jgi:hypothetical protein